MLAVEPERHPAGDEDLQSGRCGEQLTDRQGRSVDVLEVVADQQHPPLAEVGLQRGHHAIRSLVDREDARNRGTDEFRVGERGEADKPDTVGEPGGKVVRGLQADTRLADPARPRERDHPDRRVAKQLDDGGDLRCSAHQTGRRSGKVPSRPKLGRFDGKAGVLPQDRRLERPQLRARFDPQVLVERPAHAFVRRERVGCPPGAVEREHQGCLQALAVGVRRGGRLDVGQDLAVPAELELCLEQRLLDCEPAVLEPVGLGPARRIHQPRVRRSAPQPERCLENLGGALGVPGRERCGTVPGQLLEARGIELVGREAEAVAACLGGQGVGVPAESLAERRHVHLDAAERLARRVAGPQFLGECVDPL